MPALDIRDAVGKPVVVVLGDQTHRIGTVTRAELHDNKLCFEAELPTISELESWET